MTTIGRSLHDVGALVTVLVAIVTTVAAMYVAVILACILADCLSSWRRGRRRPVPLEQVPTGPDEGWEEFVSAHGLAEASAGKDEGS